MERNPQWQPGHLVGILGPGELVHGVEEDEEGPLVGGQLQQLLQVGRHRHRVVRDVLERQHVSVADLLADRPGKAVDDETIKYLSFKPTLGEARGLWSWEWCHSSGP